MTTQYFSKPSPNVVQLFNCMLWNFLKRTFFFESSLSRYNKQFTKYVINSVFNSYLYNLIRFLAIHFIIYAKLSRVRFKLN